MSHVSSPHVILPRILALVSQPGFLAWGCCHTQLPAVLTSLVRTLLSRFSSWLASAPGFAAPQEIAPAFLLLPQFLHCTTGFTQCTTWQEFLQDRVWWEPYVGAG